MLEDCSDLLACEAMLRRQAANARLLGEVALSQQDVDQLTTLIRQKLSVSATSGTRFLRRQAPASFACFLVQMGICGYQEGDYWSAVQQALGVTADANRQRQWGQAFLRFLGSQHLSRFDFEGGLTYVTPILMHGGIPDSCFDEFFEKVVFPMVRRDLMDPTDPDEVIQELLFRREDHEARENAEQRRSALQSEARSLRKELEFWRQAVDAYDQVVDLWQLEEQVADFDHLSALPANITAFREQQDQEISQLDDEIHALQERQAQRQQETSVLTDRDRRALAQATDIKRCISEYPWTREQLDAIEATKETEAALVTRLAAEADGVLDKPWQDSYGEFLIRLPFEELQDRVMQFEVTVEQQREAERALAHINTVIEEREGSRTNSLPVVTAVAGALTVIGTIITSSWLLAIIGLVLTLTTGLRSRSWHRQSTATRQQKEAWEGSLDNTTEQGRMLHRKIAEILEGLPIAQKLNASPGMELHTSLVSLATVYRELGEVRNQRQAAGEKVRPQLQLVQRLITSLDVQPTRDLENIVQAMGRLLEDAERRTIAATEAAKEVEHSIKPEIAELSKRKQALLVRGTEVEGRLAALGEGDVQSGIERLAQQRQLVDEARQQRVAVSQQYSNFRAIERHLRSSVSAGADKDSLSRKVQRLETQHRDLRAQIDQVKEEITSYRPVFPGVDEPIRRFLLYGDGPAEELLAGSVILLRRYRSAPAGRVPALDDIELPERIVAGFEKWWGEYAEDEEDEPESDEQPQPPEEQWLRSPRILLDPVAAEVTVHLPAQRYLASRGTMDLCLEVADSTSEVRQQKQPLRAYQGPRDLVETEECTFPLLFSAEHYQFILKTEAGMIEEWKIDGMQKDAPYLAFDWRSGKLITETPLRKTRIWLLIHQDLTIEPANAVLVEQVPLSGHWQQFGFYDLDLEQVDELSVLDSQGRRFSIAVSSEDVPDLCLQGGQLLEGVDSEGAPVYVGSPPHIVVPIQHEAELRNWRLTIDSEADSELREAKYYRLSDLGPAVEDLVDGNRVRVALAHDMLLGRRPIGKFMIGLKPPHRDWWSTTICVVPELQIKFDKALYLPCDTEKTERIRVTVALSEDLEFAPLASAELLERKEDLYTVRIDRSENALHGILRRLDESDSWIPISATIPKVQWRLQGLDDVPPNEWHDVVEEVWFGDWETAQELHLVVALPRTIEGTLNLGLATDPSREEKRKLEEGKARFNLLAFGEAFRAGPSRQTLTTTFLSSSLEINDAPLLHARTRWEVTELECVQEPQGHAKNLLTVTWTEWGKTGDKQRFIRLWSTENTHLPPVLEERVPEGKQRARLEADSSTVPPGKYLLQICLHDPWSPPPSHPVPSAPNMVEIEITTNTRQGEVVTLRYIADEGGRKHRLDRGFYKITIIGKIINTKPPTEFQNENILVTPANEGWYVGNLEIPPGSHLKAEIARSNPVKFEHDVSRGYVTAIEDRYGEGAMYCCECHRLFWSQEINIKETAKKHPVIGPIELFGVSWM